MQLSDVPGNGVANWSFETDTSGWEAFAATGVVTITRVTDEWLHGIASCKVVVDGASSSQGISATAASWVPAAAGEVWTGSYFAKGSGILLPRLSQINSSDGVVNINQGLPLTLSGIWQRAFVVIPSLAATTVKLRLQATTSGAQAITFHVDRMVVVPHPAAITDHTASTTPTLTDHPEC